jgi:predicted porin
MNTKMSFDFKFRHHWEQVSNYSFHTLDEDGYLQDSEYTGDRDVNFNAWNIDLNFNYWFAPASEISVVWKNSILSSGNRVESYYKDNLEALLNNPQENSLSLRVRYFLDYQYLKKK